VRTPGLQALPDIFPVVKGDHELVGPVAKPRTLLQNSSIPNAIVVEDLCKVESSLMGLT
jgi:hypothetical protein